MRGFEIERLASLGFPIGGKGGVDRFIELARGIIGHIEQACLRHSWQSTDRAHHAHQPADQSQTRENRAKMRLMSIMHDTPCDDAPEALMEVRSHRDRTRPSGRAFCDDVLEACFSGWLEAPFNSYYLGRDCQ